MNATEIIARLIDSKAINGEEAMCLTNAMSPKLVYAEPYKPTNTTPFFYPNNTSNAGICSSASTISLNEDKEQIIIDGWVARDKNGDLFLHNLSSPKKTSIDWYSNSYLSINNDLFPEVKWEDKEPTKVKLIIEKV